MHFLFPRLCLKLSSAHRAGDVFSLCASVTRAHQCQHSGPVMAPCLLVSASATIVAGHCLLCIEDGVETQGTLVALSLQKNAKTRFVKGLHKDNGHSSRL